ncbi:MAG: ABC transporter permease [Candidatus Binatia bacterium]
MLAYTVRRLVQGLGTVLGVLLFLFLLFFSLATPDDIARRAVGEKAPPPVLAQWKANHGYDRPLLWNPTAPADTLLADHFRRMLTFDFGTSDADDTPIAARLREGAGPSLALTTPLFAIDLMLGIGLALVAAYFRGTYVDRLLTLVAVLAMSIAGVLYIIGAQWLLGKELRWFPLSGFDPAASVIARFLALPVIAGTFTGIASNVRYYRTVFLEEIRREYVRAARARGASESQVMLHHVLRNALIPILTNVVIEIPFLFMGALLLESFFGIPGLGSMTVDAIHANDFATLRTMVYVGSLLFIVGQILTDLSYAVADPRVRLE